MKKNVAKRASKKEYSGDDLKRYIGAITENFQHGLSAIGEQFGGLNKKLDDHGRILDEHTYILKNHTMMIGRIMEDVEEIKSGMREKVDRSEFVKLEKRMVVLETTVFGGRKKVLNK